MLFANTSMKLFRAACHEREDVRARVVEGEAACQEPCMEQRVRLVASINSRLYHTGYPGLPVSAAAVVAAQAASSQSQPQAQAQAPSGTRTTSPEGPNSSTNGQSPMAALQSVTDNLPPGSPRSHASASPQQRSASRNSQLSPTSGTLPHLLRCIGSVRTCVPSAYSSLFGYFSPGSICRVRLGYNLS